MTQSIINCLYQEDLEGLKRHLKNDPRSILLADENGLGFPYIAAKVGNLSIVSYIVEYSIASFNDADKNGRTCLHYAVESGNKEVVCYFTDKVGLSALKGDKDGITPYHLAVSNHYEDITAFFENKTGSLFSDMYQNPIQRGMYPDPSIVRVEDDYYMVNSSFVFFPCIPISHSKDLIHWEMIGHAITNPDWAYLEDLEGGRGYWAPDISYYEGRFYITATYRMNEGGAMLRKQVVVSSDKPEGPYCEPSFIEEDGIDPSIFTDDNKERYMLLNRGARIFKISPDGTKKLSEPVLLYYGSQKRAPEGPHLLKKDGWYYLFLAENGTGRGHQISVARSKELFGNYEPCPYNPIMTQTDSNAMLQCCGHGKPVMTPNGDWYMVYLCNRYIDGKYGMLGRETAIDPIVWTKDGWPIVNSLQGPSVLQKKPSLPEYKMESKNIDSFDQPQLSKEWMGIRTKNEGGLTLQEEGLCIRGSQYEMNDIKAENLCLRRQKDFCFDVVLTMKLPVLIDEQNAGMISYYDENTYLKFAVYSNQSKEYELRVFEKIDEAETFTLAQGLSLAEVEEKEDIYLKMEVKELERKFSYSLDNKNWTEVGTLTNVYYLCSEGIVKGKRFTGATIGMYAYAGIQELTVCMKEFSYTPITQI